MISNVSTTFPGINSIDQLQSLQNSQQKPVPTADKGREVFDQFVGETFFGQMLASMRKSVGKPAYFHGGRAEEVFQGQLDQVLGEHLSKASEGSFSGPMYELFTLARAK